MRDVASIVLISPSSRRRPTKLVTSAGRFPGRRLGLAIVLTTLQGQVTAGRLHIESAILSIRLSGSRLTLTTMTQELPNQRVEVLFVGFPPAEQIARASGVSDVEVDGYRVCCLVCGSFQPFLEALRGYEVIALTATSVPSQAERGPDLADGQQRARDRGGG
jgi:hypothetical protein